MSSTDRIGVALIGGGIFAKREHIPAIVALPKLFELKAIYSRTHNSASETEKRINDVLEDIKWNSSNPSDLADNKKGERELSALGSVKPDLYSEDSGDGKSYADLLKRDDITAVIIVLPIMHQPEYIRQALLAGKHVLSEKPVAADVKTALELVEFHANKCGAGGPTWSVAENFRFMPKFRYAASKASTMGRLLTFEARVYFMVSPDSQYMGTEWRANPEYQGGFLLDGGVHFAAALRQLLAGANGAKDETDAGDGSGKNKIETVAAFSSLVQPHLKPVDTLHAVLRTASGVVGSFGVSAGTTVSTEEYTLGCERGALVVNRSGLNIEWASQAPADADDGSEQDQFVRSSGVQLEIEAWAETIKSGKVSPALSPQQAIADVELIEVMLRSANEGGKVLKLQHQV